MSAEAYDSEDLLQRLLATWPNLLAGAQIDPEAPRQWLFVAREVGIPGEDDGCDQWSLDHLFLDQDGIPTFVEVKRSSDTRLRREVVGQMLDYAANAVVYWPPDRIRELAEANTANDDILGEEMLKTAFGGNVDPEAYWARVRTNLQACRIRLLFVADQIPPELRRVVEFLNKQMDPAEVLALELKQYVGADNKKTFVPRVFGQIPGPKIGPHEPWGPRFFDALAARCSKPAVQAAQKIFDWLCDSFSGVSYGSGKRSGSFGAGPSKTRLFNVWTYGSLEICFVHLKAFAPFEDVARRKELIDRLTKVVGISFQPDAIDQRPSISLEKLADENALQALISVLDLVVSEMRKAGSMPPSQAGTNSVGPVEV